MEELTANPECLRFVNLKPSFWSPISMPEWKQYYIEWHSTILVMDADILVYPAEAVTDLITLKSRAALGRETGSDARLSGDTVTPANPRDIVAWRLKRTHTR